MSAEFNDELNAAPSAPRRSFRRRVVDFAKLALAQPWFEPFIIAVIVINAAVLGLQTDPDFTAKYGGIADRLDTFVLVIFVVELGLKLIAQGLRFFRSGWNWFDLIVVAVSLMPDTAGFSIFRAARILRLLRLMSIIPKMRRVIGGFFGALPSMAGVIGILAIIFYVSAVAATTLFGKVTLAEAPPGTTPEDIEMIRTLFGSLSASFFTLFQLMTLENWADGIVIPTLKLFPNAMWFFIPFIVLTSFAVLNLFIGIIVDSMSDEQRQEQAERDAEQDASQAEALAETRKRAAEIRAAQTEDTSAILLELRRLRAEIEQLKAQR